MAPHSTSRALLCTVVGEKYEAMYRNVRRQFEAYAERCSAELIVIRGPLDDHGLHSLMTQRLLIPSRFERFDLAAHLDIDVLIPAEAADIFSSLPADAAFGAVVDPRGTQSYSLAWNQADFTSQTHAEYYAGKDLRSERPLYSINGGALLFRTAMTGRLFSNWYHDRQRYAGKPDSYYHNEEDPAAFLTQSQGTFFSLPPRFNRQLIYALCESPEGLAARKQLTSPVQRIRRRIARALGVAPGPMSGMRRYASRVEALLRNGDIVHLSASYPAPVVDPAILIG